MAKLKCEIDTETKTMAFYKDDQKLDCDEVSMGSYKDIDADGELCDCCFASYRMTNPDGSTTTHSIRMDAKKMDEMSHCSLASEIKKAVTRAVASNKLSKVLTSKK